MQFSSASYQLYKVARHNLRRRLRWIPPWEIWTQYWLLYVVVFVLNNVLITKVARRRSSSLLGLVADVVALTCYMLLDANGHPQGFLLHVSIATDHGTCMGRPHPTRYVCYSLDDAPHPRAHFWLTVGWDTSCTTTLPIGTC